MSSTPIVPHQALNFNRSHVGMALRRLRVGSASLPATLTAINKAALNLEACVWLFDGARLHIESATQLGNTFYDVTAGGCTCPSGAPDRPCWHKAARELLVIAQRLAVPHRSPVDIQADADALFD